MKKTIQISGMHCKSCKSLIEGEVSDMEGVVGISINEKQATVELESDSLNSVLEKIKSLGYGAELKLEGGDR